MDCRIRLAQVDTTLGNLELNLEAHLVAIEKAASDEVDLVVFPELSLTGYFLKDQTAEVALDLDAPELQVVAERSNRISIALGFVERGPDGRVFNSVGFFEDGALKQVHRKVHLVNYGMFEESRDLASGDTFEFVDSKHGRFGILTCEDMWHVDGSYLYFLDGVDAFLVCSASPGRGVTGDSPELESNRVWRTLQDAMTLYFRTWTLYVNRVGWEDGIVFAGGSRVVDPFGHEVDKIDGFDPGDLDVRVTSDVTKRARIQTPLRRDERPWILARELARRVGLEPRADDEERSEP
jgi:NAD+ synthase (glutamine-hydrolysing)